MPGKGNPITRRARQRRYQYKINAMRRELARRAKDVPCADCGQRYPYYVMDFDHVRGEKKFCIGVAVGTNIAGINQFLDEIAKCEVVCSNCHRTRTFVRSKTRAENN